MSLLNHEVFNSSYNGQTLILPEQNWDQFPVRVTPNEMQTIDLPKVLEILRKIECSPTTVAGLEPDQVQSFIITRMDAAWTQLKTDLTNNLQKAEIKDLENYQPYTKAKWLAGAGCAASGAGAGALLGLSVGPIGVGLGTTVGLITGIFAGLFGTRKVIDIQAQKDASAHRLAWMQKATIMTSEFRNELKTALKLGGKQLFLELQELKKSNQISLDKLRKLQELLTVFKAHFPDEEMLIEQTSIETYINQLKKLL